MSAWDDPTGRIRELEAEVAHLLDQLEETRKKDDEDRARVVANRHYGRSA